MQRLTDAIHKDIESELYDGAVIIVARDGEVLLDEALGYADRANRREMRKDHVFAAFSISKAITAIAALQWVERGALRLNQPIAELIPEFGIKGKQRINLQQLLCHTAGMPSAFPNVDLEDQGDLDKVFASVCNEALVTVPGEACQYSPIMAHAVAGELIRRFDGTAPLRDIVERDLLKPLGMTDTALGLRADLADRAAPVVARDRRPGMFDAEAIEQVGATILDPENGTEIPAAGFVSTAEGIFRFAEMLRRGGELDGARVLSQPMIALAVSNHTGDLSHTLFNYAREMRGWPEFPANLGLGFALRGSGAFPTYFGATASPRTFGAIGAGSTLFWVDPERDITFVCLTTGLLEESHSCDRFMRLSEVAIAAAMS